MCGKDIIVNLMEKSAFSGYGLNLVADDLQREKIMARLLEKYGSWEYFDEIKDHILEFEDRDGHIIIGGRWRNMRRHENKDQYMSSIEKRFDEVFGEDDLLAMLSDIELIIDDGNGCVMEV